MYKHARRCVQCFFLKHSFDRNGITGLLNEIELDTHTLPK